jgi:hypothetical protein
MDPTMTSSYVAHMVRTALIERGLQDTLLRVAPLPFSWEVTLQGPSGVEQHLIIPDGGMRGLQDAIRSALEAE